MGEFYGVMIWRVGFIWGIWGGEVYDEGEGLGMGIVKNGFGVGFLGDVAIEKYSARESAFINSFRENKPPILIGFLR